MIKVSKNKFESFVADLPAIFEKHFNHPVDNDVDGPFIRFAHQTLVELGITRTNGRLYSLESIAKAVALAIRGQNNHGKTH